MRIGLLSDTHIQDGGPGLASQVSWAFAGVEMVLDCGDLETMAILDWLEEIAEVKAVRGHADPHERGRRLAELARVMEVEGVRIGMIHDLELPGPPIGFRDGRLIFPSVSLEEVLRQRLGQLVEVVAFGDTHEEVVESRDGVLFVNPGSTGRPGLCHRAGSPGTVALLFVAAGGVTARIVDLAELQGGAILDLSGIDGLR